MTAASLAGLAAAAAVLAVAGAHRPVAPPRRTLTAGAVAAGDGPRTSRGPASAVGALVRRPWGRSDDPAADRRVGRVALASLAVAAVVPVLGLAVVAGAGVVGLVRRRTRARVAARAIVEELPEVVDLLVLATSAGLTVPLALEVAVDRGSGRVAGCLRRALDQSAQGRGLVDALDGLVDELGDDVRRLVRVLTGALRDGTSVVPALERLADEVRTERRRAAEERARRLPVRLLFPLVVCILPAFALLTVVPLLAGAISGLPR